jgi:uncharacterized protein Smg (DUF494 family)
MFKKKVLIDEITDYIKKNLRKGYTKESLKWALINQGYSRMEIERSIKRVDEELANKAPILKTKPEITYEVVEPKQVKKRKWF